MNGRIIAAVPSSPKIRLILGVVAVPSPEHLAEGRRLLLAYIAASLDLDRGPGLARGTLDPFLACLDIAGPASVDCFLDGGVVEVPGEEIVECAVIAEIREVHSLGSCVAEIVELEMGATSGFAEHIHNRLPLDQGFQMQETSQLVLPFDLVL